MQKSSMFPDPSKSGVSLPAIKRVVHRYSFATKDQDGRIRMLDVSAPILNVSDALNPDAEVEGPYQFKTREGEPVADLSGGRYCIVKTGEVLTAMKLGCQ